MRWDSYINSVIGKPWENRKRGKESFDCYGLLIDAFEKVKHLEIPIADGYFECKAIETIGKNELEKQNWIETTSNYADAFAAYDKNGNMFHVGAVTPHGCLHAFGLNGNGSVALHKLSKLIRLLQLSNPQYKELKFYRYANC